MGIILRQFSIFLECNEIILTELYWASTRTFTEMITKRFLFLSKFVLIKYFDPLT